MPRTEEIEDMKTEGGLPIDELAASAYRAFGWALRGAGGQDTPAWDSISEEEQNAWGLVALKSLQFDQTGMEASVDTIAGNLFQSYLRVMGQGQASATSFAEWPFGVKTCWRAVARHLSYLCSQADPNENLGELESQWHRWAADARPA